MIKIISIFLIFIFISCQKESYEINKDDVVSVGILETKYFENFYKFNGVNLVEADSDSFGEVFLLKNADYIQDFKVRSCDLGTKLIERTRAREVEKTKYLMIIVTKKFSFGLFRMNGENRLKKLKIKRISRERIELEMGGCYEYVDKGGLDTTMIPNLIKDAKVVQSNDFFHFVGNIK
ncbi:hypothetical protein EHQ71_10680 [Leptospira levettii]|uniref:hypothetical protein n=1 Tax=Leptospira levettii TaxID=2023178 RepID=UPI001082D951|nr:hypothetical protein [Leptospira levettii]TGM30480.1 hypothetical protein EHQ71_10680 [Leptospira levettii]